MGRILAILVGLVCGAAASQVPEFVTQYTQRLGGWLNAYDKVVAELDQRAANLEMSREDYIAALKVNKNAEARQEGDHLAKQVLYQSALRKAYKSLADAPPLMRGARFVQNYNPVLAEATWSAFRPALPATIDGLAYGGAGFVVGWLGLILIGLPFRLWRRRRQSAAE